MGSNLSDTLVYASEIIIGSIIIIDRITTKEFKEIYRVVCLECLRVFRSVCAYNATYNATYNAITNVNEDKNKSVSCFLFFAMERNYFCVHLLIKIIMIRTIQL